MHRAVPACLTPGPEVIMAGSQWPRVGDPDEEVLGVWI